MSGVLFSPSSPASFWSLSLSTSAEPRARAVVLAARFLPTFTCAAARALRAARPDELELELELESD